MFISFLVCVTAAAGTDLAKDVKSITKSKFLLFLIFNTGLAKLVSLCLE